MINDSESIMLIPQIRRQYQALTVCLSVTPPFQCRPYHVTTLGAQINTCNNYFTRAS